ncbi:hypothetical protein ACX27_27325 [Nostoc piscinale CENA21]|uniref:DUF7694 domain-containing protein n=1 Tax=Nostoc piscinale CENA21 TaxID=224013 RepID=A0A0M3V6I8_9NOSO|nr:hypothetical protein [Nostoc piscinale]ALF55723.1 hypothetical protein ACX27_27325 [Nostoc piscinale CENA21]
MSISQLVKDCERLAIASLNTYQQRGYGEKLPLPQLPDRWKLEQKTDIGSWWEGSLESGFSAPRFLVGYTLCLENDDKLWLHISISKKQQGKKRTIPDYYEAQKICRLFFGNLPYIQYFPPQEEYVNIAEVLHFWHCLDGNPLPDFRKFGRI